MGAKIATRYAGAVCAVFVFLLVCGFDIPSSQAAWQIETVPCSRTPGAATLALDANSFPHIAVAADNYLMYAYKDVSGWQEETVSDADYVYLPVIDLDSSGYPHIFWVYEYFVGGGIGVEHYYKISRKDASGWHSSTLSDPAFYTSYYGLPYSFSLDTNDVEHSFCQSYRGMFDTAIYYDAERVVSTNPVSNRLASDLAMDSGNYPHTCYRGSINLPLTYLYKDAAGWHTETVDVEGNTADYLSLGLDSYDRPHVSYYDNVNKDLKYAYRDETGWHIETLDSAGDVGMYNSIGIDSLDNPHISYYDETNKDLKYAYRDGSGWHIETVDSAGDVGVGSSLDIDSLDRPHILYRDQTNAALKYALEDAHPAIGVGPYVTTDWKLLPTSPETPCYIKKNVGILWTFSDDFASCAGPCTHTAEYQVPGSGTWTALSVSSDAVQGYAWVDLPISQLQNATTYAFRFTITDCASQSTQSETYYFKVDRPDQPPVFLSEPLWFGSWVGLSSDPANPQKPQSQDILFWAQDDDKLACTGATEPSWMYRPVELQEGMVVPLGDWITQKPWRFMMYVWIETPGIVDIVGPGLFEFKMTATDCLDQTIDSEGFWGKRYYFQVD